MAVSPSYFYRLTLDGAELPVSSSQVPVLTITEDLNRYLPAVRIKVYDPGGDLTHLWPIDQAMKLRVEFGYQQDDSGSSGKGQVSNIFDFVFYRRYPVSEFGTSGAFEATGLLDVTGIFSPDYSRAFTGSVKSSLESIALKDLKLDKADVDPSLGYVRTLLQPLQSNSEFLNFHKENLAGSSGQGGFYCFVKVENGKKVFVFKSLSAMVSAPAVYSYIDGDQPTGDRLPLYSYEIVDNFQLLGSFLGSVQDYSYFDYENGRYVNAVEKLEDYFSLAEYHGLRVDAPAHGNRIVNTGRTTEFDNSFQGKARSIYWDKLTGLSKIWVTGWGNPNVSPGDTVNIVFSQAMAVGNVEYYQYSGFWLVERVVHTLTDTFRTRLLLTRNGVDSKAAVMFVKAVKRKKS